MMLTEAPALSCPDWKSFLDRVQASNVGIGAVISQLVVTDGEMIQRPISSASQALNKAKRNYSVTDREGLALSGQ